MSRVVLADPPSDTLRCHPRTVRQAFAEEHYRENALGIDGPPEPIPLPNPLKRITRLFRPLLERTQR